METNDVGRTHSATLVANSPKRKPIAGRVTEIRRRERPRWGSRSKAAEKPSGGWDCASRCRVRRVREETRYRRISIAAQGAVDYTIEENEHWWSLKQDEGTVTRASAFRPVTRGRRSSRRGSRDDHHHRVTYARKVTVQVPVSNPRCRARSREGVSGRRARVESKRAHAAPWLRRDSKLVRIATNGRTLSGETTMTVRCERRR